MAYGIYLQNTNTGQSLFDDTLFFYPTTRSGISTSDPYYFQTFNFSANTISVYFEQFGNVISSSASNTFSNINFNLNEFGFDGLCLNLSRPTVVEICPISSYEIGVAQTVYSSTIAQGDKMIRNLTDPGNIYIVNNTSPLSFSTSYFGLSLNYAWTNQPNFLYTKFTDTELTKYFLAVPNGIGATIPGNFSWLEIPGETFYFNADYYITLTFTGFTGASLPLSAFNGIVPNGNQTILINNSRYNDTLSGLYSIYKISDKVYLSNGSLNYNYPGQIFNITINLDNSNSMLYNSAIYYVPYAYGYAAAPFTNNLLLTQSGTINSTPNSYIPLYKDQYSKSSLILPLNTQSALAKQSDTFVLGVAVSNWCPDCVMFGVGLGYEIKEGY